MGVAYGVSCCTRSFLVLLNLAMMVVALAALALAIWIRCDDSFEESIRSNLLVRGEAEPMGQLKEDMRTWITVSFWVIVGFCIACAIIGLAGLLGAASRSRVLVALYFVALLIVILLEIAVGIFVLVERHKVVRDAVKEYVQVSYQMQLRDVQTLEYRYDCCGVENFANPQCNPLLPTCSSAVWDRLDYTLMVFGCSMLAVIVCQVITALIALVLVGTPSRYADA
ncbi:unnamed protein product, partial [Mesorhabditis belari]|uniref:Tetraspanin n=1 Tax=Mesorhabditis belari TaxID=2138241 RepID=A0AAF3FF08_9BILA